MSDIKTYFDNKQQAMIDLLTELVNIESPSKNKQAVDNMGNRVAELFEATGAKVERHPREAVGDIIVGKWNANADGKPIVIISHMDTVWDIGNVAERPVRFDDEGRMFGPGAVDMKGGIVITLFALQGLIERGELPNRPIWYLATSDEEIGSKYSRELIENAA